MAMWVNSLFEEGKIKKLAIFGCFNEHNIFATKRFNIGEEARARIAQRDTGKSSLYQLLGYPSSPYYGEDAEQLANIIDERLVLFDATELAYAYEMSNDVFWEAIEGL
jgi:hypothetical protein